MKIAVRPGVAFWFVAIFATLNIVFAVTDDSDTAWVNFLVGCWLAALHIRECRRLAAIRQAIDDDPELFMAWCVVAGSRS